MDNNPSCFRLKPIDKEKLNALSHEGKANPSVVKTLTCKTVAEGRFRHSNFIRNLEPYIVDEPPSLLGDDSAPNPSEALLAALGSCIAVGIHANAINEDIEIYKLELRLEGDINITAVWGTGDLDESKTLGFSEVRVNVDLEANIDDARKNALIAHAIKWSPVANTLMRQVRVVAQ